MATTLLQLRTRARSRAEMTNSTFCTDSEINDWLNLGLAELYDLTVRAYEDYYTVPQSISISAGNSVVLPSTFYKLRAVDYDLNGQWVGIGPYNFEQRNRRGSSDLWSAVFYTGRRYRLMGPNFTVTPVDSAIGTYQLWVIPFVTKLANNTDEIPAFLSDTQWDEYIVLYAVERMLSKEESSVADVVRERGELLNRITQMAADRQVDQSEQIQDVTGFGYPWGDYGY